jgi:hypothetical protein
MFPVTTVAQILLAEQHLRLLCEGLVVSAAPDPAVGVVISAVFVAVISATKISRKTHVNISRKTNILRKTVFVAVSSSSRV